MTTSAQKNKTVNTDDIRNLLDNRKLMDAINKLDTTEQKLTTALLQKARKNHSWCISPFVEGDLRSKYGVRPKLRRALKAAAFNWKESLHNSARLDGAASLEIVGRRTSQYLLFPRAMQPLVAWKPTKGKLVLLDGIHNGLACRLLGVTFSVYVISGIDAQGARLIARSFNANGGRGQSLRESLTRAVCDLHNDFQETPDNISCVASKYEVTAKQLRSALLDYKFFMELYTGGLRAGFDAVQAALRPVRSKLIHLGTDLHVEIMQQIVDYRIKGKELSSLIEDLLDAGCNLNKVRRTLEMHGHMHCQPAPVDNLPKIPLPLVRRLYLASRTLRKVMTQVKGTLDGLVKDKTIRITIKKSWNDIVMHIERLSRKQPKVGCCSI